MHLTHVAMSAALTVSVAGISYAALKPADLEKKARVVAAQATCRAVDAAIVAYAAQRETIPATVADLRGYVKGDISAYRIVDGMAAGPGC